LPVGISVKGTTDHIGQPGPSSIACVGNEREITIVGPGGAGKTTLARQITLWLQDDNDLTRRIGAKPVSLFLSDGPKNVIEAVQSLVQDRLNMEVDRELIVALLRKGRLAVVLDGLSERGDVAEEYRQELRSKVLARLTITTSRTEHDRVFSSAVVMKPTTLNSESLVSLVKAILSTRLHTEAQAIGKMSVQLAVATHLAEMVENTQSGVTPLLVEAFVKQAERLIAEDRSLDDLPRSTAGAYLGYVRELTSRGGPDVNSFKLLKTTMQVASICIDDEFRPCPVDYDKALKVLASEGLGEAELLNLRRLGLLKLLDTGVPIKLKFELDPIAEYCAVEYWREHKKVYEWEEVREKAQENLPTSAGIVRAIQDIEKYSG
jgi:adenylate kinase family enzyme